MPCSFLRVFAPGPGPGCNPLLFINKTSGPPRHTNPGQDTGFGGEWGGGGVTESANSARRDAAGQSGAERKAERTAPSRQLKASGE